MESCAQFVYNRTIIYLQVFVENVHFTDGHGASIGSIPDCNGCHGYVSNIHFKNCTFGGNAPMKIKYWCA